MIGGLDWGALQSFLTLARAERLTVAAKREGIDHSTLSRRINLLERSLDAILFDRTPSGYILTPDGQSVLRIAEEMESASLKIANDTPGHMRTISGVVRIAAPDIFGSRFLAPRIGVLADKFPLLEIHLVPTPRPSNLTKREADVAVTSRRPERGRLHSKKLVDYELGLFATEKYLSTRATVREIKDLHQHRLIGYVDDLLFLPELDYFSSIGDSLRPTLCSTTLHAQSQTILADAGIGVLPLWMATGEPTLHRVLADDVAIHRAYWLTFNSDMRDIAAVRAVCDFITDTVRSEKGRFSSTVAARSGRID